jgi:hypothetical protein
MWFSPITSLPPRVPESLSGQRPTTQVSCLVTSTTVMTGRTEWARLSWQTRFTPHSSHFPSTRERSDLYYHWWFGKLIIPGIQPATKQSVSEMSGYGRCAYRWMLLDFCSMWLVTYIFTQIHSWMNIAYCYGRLCVPVCLCVCNVRESRP